MPSNHFDKASRYAAKLDAEAFLDWLMPGWSETVHFGGWLETRTIPFPGEADRICDTVAKLVNSRAAEEVWAVPIEFQTKPDVDMFGRLLEYLGRFWIELRPPEPPHVRYSVAGAVVNLTGVEKTSKTMRLNSIAYIELAVAEKNLATESASEILEGIGSGRLGHSLLPWIPLMQNGGNPRIIDAWKNLAEREPITRRRADYAGLALVFSELTGCHKTWRQALEGWNVEQSLQVLEWQAAAEQRGRREGKIEGKIDAILHLLGRRFPTEPISAEVVARLQSITNSELLDRLLDEAVTVSALSDFQKILVAMNGLGPKA